MRGYYCHERKSLMSKLSRLLLVAFLGIFIQGCAAFDWLVYKIDIPQGNYLDEEHVQKLRISMTKEQVEYVLGQSLLQDTFNDDTWYYVYYMKSGLNAKVTQKSILIYFQKNKVVKIDSDYELNPDFNKPLDSTR